MKFGEDNIIVMKKIVPFGTSGHIILPRRFLRKEVMIVIPEKIIHEAKNEGREKTIE